MLKLLKSGRIGVLLLPLLLASSSAVVAAWPTVAIASFKPLLMIFPGGTVSIPLSVSYSLPSNSCVAIIIAQPGSRNYTWYNPDYQTARSGQGTLSYTATFRAPLLPGIRIYEVIAFYWDGTRWVQIDKTRFAVQVTFTGYIVDQLLNNQVEGNILWLSCILGIGFLGILVHRRNRLSKLILISIACLLLLESFAWFFQPIFYSSIYSYDTLVFWEEVFSSWTGTKYSKEAIMFYYAIISFLLLGAGLVILSYSRIPSSEKIEIEHGNFILGKIIVTDRAVYEINGLLVLIPFFFLMYSLTIVSALLARALPEHVWLIAMSLSYFYIAWRTCKRSIRSRPTRLYNKIRSELHTIATINVPPSESVESKSGESVKFKASSKSGKIIITDKAIYCKKGFFFPVKRYDYSEVLCAFTDIFSSPTRKISVEKYDGPYFFASDARERCSGARLEYEDGKYFCTYKGEEYFGGWAWGSVKLLLWNGKIVTVYSILFAQSQTEEFDVTEELEEAVWRGIKVVLHELCPCVPCYDDIPRSVRAKIAEMAERGRSREEIKRSFQAMMNDSIYRS